MTDNKLSLEDRILQLMKTEEEELPDFPDDKSDLPSDFEYNPDDYEEEEEVIENISESDLIQYLDQQEHPLSVVHRLFYHELNTPQHKQITRDLKCLLSEKAEELYSRGWTSVEGLIDLDILRSAHQAAQQLVRDNKFESPQQLAEKSTDSIHDMKARDDTIIWLNTIKQLPYHSPFDKIISFIEGPLYDDLAKLVHLKGNKEYQLSYYHKQGARYEVHRDALPTDRQTEDQRRITVIVYLNPGWSPGDGGELNIKSHRDRHGMPEGVDNIQKPLLGNIFLCMSGATDYEILPTKKEIFILTCWLR
ncbi:hypothetical protein BDB01DRAFT_809061 [Pilobolus umbonatus]|nr:hypothetical protein BDB01DRAFT_809061 [Pilobolus umbonatus]